MQQYICPFEYLHWNGEIGELKGEKNWLFWNVEVALSRIPNFIILTLSSHVQQIPLGKKSLLHIFFYWSKWHWVPITNVVMMQMLLPCIVKLIIHNVTQEAVT